MLSTPPASTTSAAPDCTIIAAVDDGLEPTATATVELHAGHLDGQPRLRSATHRPMHGVSAVRIRLRENEIVDACGIDATALDDRLDDRGRQHLDGNRPQTAAKCPNGRT